MTVLEALAAAASIRPEPERDRYGRYLIPDPTTGEKRAWTRATTFAKTVSDTFGLTKWELRMVALGLAKRSDLLAQVAGVIDPDDGDAKKLLDSIAAQAKEAAGSSTRANLGTALHTMTEHIDAGRDFAIPDAHRADLDAYRAATSALTVDPAHIERIVTLDRYGIAGTFDRLVTLPDGRLVVADLKTGRSLAGMAEYAIQLALYANADTIWNQITGEHEPMPPVDRSQALIIWLPAGEARCELHTVDIAAGWAMAEVCETVRAWRKRRDLSGPYTGVLVPNQAPPATIDPPAQPVPADRSEWITQRIDTLVLSRAAKAMLADSWPAGMPKRGPWTDDQVDAIDAVLAPIEAAVEAPFPHRDPAVVAAEEAARAAEEAALPVPLERPTPDDGTTVPDEDRDALKRKAAELEPTRAQRCAAWRAEGKRHGHPWGGAVDGAWTQRCWSDNRAALLCAIHLYDPDDDEIGESYVRAALSLVIGTDVQPTWATGAVIGTLTIDEAERLSDIAARAGDADTEIWRDLASAVA